MTIKKESAQRYVLWFATCVVMIWFKFSHHELWKDEWQAYLVARDMSLREMFAFLNYEGHPALWYIYLKIVALFSEVFSPHEESLIQLGHSILLAGSMYLLYVKTKAPLWVKVGIGVSYFFGFQYGIVNRGYILVILFGLLAVVQLQNKKDDRWLAVTLFLLCQTEVYGVFVAGVLLLYSLLPYRREGIAQMIGSGRLSLAGVVAGFVAFVWSVFPRGNRDDFSRAYNQELLNGDNFLIALQGNTANAFLPGILPDTNIAGWSMAGLLLSLASLVLFYMLFRKSTAALIAMTTMLIVMLLFGLLIYSGGIRQWGATYIVFALLALLVADQHWRADKWAMIAFGVIAIAQLVHNIRAHERDYRLPFSITPQVASFIEEKVPTAVPIVAINKFETAAVGAYADRPLYELPTGTSFTYFKWLEKVYLPTQSELDLFTRFKNVGGIILLSPTPVDTDRFHKAKLWQSFEEPTYKMERMYIYSVPLK